MKRSKIKISVIGLWHQGIVTAACLSEAGYNVIGIDSDSKIIKNLNSTITPVFEPGLDLILAKQIKKKAGVIFDPI